MAVISLDFAAVARWPSTSPAPAAKAETRCSAVVSTPPGVERGNTRQNYRHPVGKLGDEGKLASHRLDGAPERRDVHIGARLDLRDLLLRDAEFFRQANLSHGAGATQFLQSHFLG